MLQQLKTQPALIDQVHDRLIAAIVHGDLSEGQKLTQESVAEMLGVSRQPVSHALQILKRRGLLIEHGKRSLAVAPMSGNMVRDLYQVRAALDGLAAACAADRVAKGRVTDIERRILENAVLVGKSLNVDSALSVRIEADVAFHAAVHTLSGNPQIAATMTEQWPHFMRSMSLVLVTAQSLQQFWEEHEAISTAILAGDADTAERAAAAHANCAGDRTARRLDDRAAVA